MGVMINISNTLHEVEIWSNQRPATFYPFFSCMSNHFEGHKGVISGDGEGGETSQWSIIYFKYYL
jgi:hypothetical protein